MGYYYGPAHFPGAAHDLWLDHPVVWALRPLFGNTDPVGLLAFWFSGILGLFFGFYLAYKASFLNPIDALHCE